MQHGSSPFPPFLFQVFRFELLNEHGGNVALLFLLLTAFFHLHNLGESKFCIPLFTSPIMGIITTTRTGLLVLLGEISTAYPRLPGGTIRDHHLRSEQPVYQLLTSHQQPPPARYSPPRPAPNSADPQVPAGATTAEETPALTPPARATSTATVPAGRA